MAILISVSIWIGRFAGFGTIFSCVGTMQKKNQNKTKKQYMQVFYNFKELSMLIIPKGAGNVQYINWKCDMVAKRGKMLNANKKMQLSM